MNIKKIGGKGSSDLNELLYCNASDGNGQRNFVIL
jgi:hypothetical protein